MRFRRRCLADEANHVDRETAATQTSHDRDEENPTPGGNHPGPKGETGDSERTKIADSEEHAAHHAAFASMGARRTIHRSDD